MSTQQKLKLSVFRFDAAITATIENLKNSTSATSKSDVIRRAIALMKVVQEANDNGEKIILQKKDTKGKVVMERQIILP
jgi:hypothetical protein